MPAEFEEIEVPTPPPTTEDEAGFFEDAFAHRARAGESFEAYALRPAPAEAVPQEEYEENLLAFLLAEGADAAVPASPSVPEVVNPEVLTDSSEGGEGAAAADGEDVGVWWTRRLDGARSAPPPRATGKQ